MGQQIIRQPDGRYALWSSVVDTFVLIDATPDEIVEHLVEREAGRLRQSVDRIVAELNAGGKPYSQFTMTWDEAIHWHKEIHGFPFDLAAARMED